jgi:hypothetical protein
MTTTITDGQNTVTPDLVLGWETSQETRNVIHPIIGRSSPDFTIKPSNLRTGTMSLFFKDYEQAELCRNMHINAAVFQLYTSNFNEANMRYVVFQEVTMTLEETTLRYWTIGVQFQEIT